MALFAVAYPDYRPAATPQASLTNSADSSARRTCGLTDYGKADHESLRSELVMVAMVGHAGVVHVPRGVSRHGVSQGLKAA